MSAPVQAPAKPERLLAWGILAVLAYMAVRAVLYIYMPVRSWDQWFVRDAVMSGPRLLLLGASLFLMRRHGPWRAYGWHWSRPAAAAAAMAAEAAGYILLLASGTAGIVFTRSQIASGWLTTLPVALAEEACFRGALFAAFLRLTSPRWAALGSAVLFTVYHYQAQPLSEWPYIFAFGFVACAALFAGLGLPWLVLAHELVDSVWFHIGSDGAPGSESLWLQRLAVVLILGAAAWSWRRLEE